MSSEKPRAEAATDESASNTAGADGRVIKRYSNRKLYDTRDSRYVTLLQIAELVRSGEDVRIIDNTTKEDLTEVTLAQIIFEEQKSKGRNVPLQTLKEMIQARTEKVLSDLREGPIGRLIPGTPATGPKDRLTPLPPEPEPPRAEPPPRPESKARLVDQAKVTLEDWQHKIDDRIRAIVPSLKPWHELEEEVRHLRERVDQLEKELRKK